MKILVTGTTGFIGSHLAIHLAESGHEVVATARHPETLPALSAVPRIRQARLDLQDRKDWASLLQGCDGLIHVALGWGDEGPAMLERDTAASVALFEAAKQAGTRTVVYTSSTAANGEMSPLNEADRAPRPLDLYGATKAATEMYARAYAATGSQSYHVVRPGYVFGESAVEGGRSQPDRRFREICGAVLQGRSVEIVRHDGTQFIHARDLARVYEACLSDERSFSIHYGLARSWVSWEWVAKEAMKIAGREVPLEIRDLGYGSEPYLFDVSGIREDFALSFPNEERLRAHLAWELDRTGRELRSPGEIAPG